MQLQQLAGIYSKPPGYRRFSFSYITGLLYNRDMDDINQKLSELEKKIDDIHKSVLTIKRIFFWTAIVSIAAIVLPLIGLVFVIPQFISSYGSYGNLLR